MIKPQFREQFCRDFRLPIKIYSSPYFEYFIETFRTHFDLDTKISIFNSMINHYKDLGPFKDDWQKLKDSIAGEILQLPEYEVFRDQAMYSSPYSFEKGTPYNHKYNNEECLSIDLISANFNSLKYFNPKIVLNTNNFNELLERFTKVEYFKHIKIFRQLALEPLNPKKQQCQQRKMMDSLSKEIFKILPNLFMKMPSNDELIIPLVANQKDVKEAILDVINNHELNSILRVEHFKVSHVLEDTFAKVHTDGKIELKNIDHSTFPQAFKLAYGKPIDDMDLFFMMNKKLSKFIK